MTAPAHLDLPAQPLSTRQARHWVREALAGLSSADLLDAVELLTGELVTNALIHAGTPVRLRLRPGPDEVRVEVHDGSPVPPRRQHYSAVATTGRGIGLLDDLADDWGWFSDPDGKTVWFQLLHAGSAGAGPGDRVGPR